MPQSTTSLVKDLIAQFNQFIELSDSFGPELKTPDCKFSVSLSYSFLKFRINKGGLVYFQCAVFLEAYEDTEWYYHDKQKIETVKKHFAALNRDYHDDDGKSSVNKGSVKFSETLGTYLTIAESIARCAYLCAKGDDYRPGYFSEIAIDEQEIMLRQINHMNAKSLDHKKDYSLRDLEFFIPLEESAGLAPKRLMIGEEYIGKMRVRFDDRSSENNRGCGDLIRSQMTEEKGRFGS
jgi:hypothetical protein